MIAINQDELGVAGDLIWQQGASRVRLAGRFPAPGWPVAPWLAHQLGSPSGAALIMPYCAAACYLTSLRPVLPCLLHAGVRGTVGRR